MSGIEDLKQKVDNSETSDRINIFDSNASNRVEIDLSTMPAKEEEQPGVDIRESLTKDILEGENSPFSKYKQEKIKEMEERMAEYDQEQELDEEESDKELDENVEISSGSVYIEDNKEIGVVDSESDSSLYSDWSYTVDTEDISDIEKSSDNDDNEAGTVETADNVETKPEPVKVETPDIDIDVTSSEVTIEDINIESEEDIQEQDQSEILKHLQKLATERLKPVSKNLDISSFTILKKPSQNTKILQQQQVKVAKWVLPNQESVVLMKEYTGSELESLREFSEDNSSMTQLSRKYHSIYDHIASEKPSTFETWAKTTPFADIDHYFFAVYISAFKGANFLPADCEDSKCKEAFLTNDIEIMSMVKFDNENAKSKFLDLYKSEAMPAGKGLYCTEVVPLSEKIAVVFREPSVYSLFEIACLDDKFKDKHSSIIEYIPYIDSLYLIDPVNKLLTPVGYKVYADNATKSTKSKINMISKLLGSLTIDEFGAIKAYIRALTDRNVGIRYVYPSVTCPKCGKPVKEKPASAEELVFTRFQLGALVNTSLK